LNFTVSSFDYKYRFPVRLHFVRRLESAAFPAVNASRIELRKQTILATFAWFCYGRRFVSARRA
jgi:hypothetical protein